MNYTETLQRLYAQAPAFQKIGGAAYKPGLDTSHALDVYFGHPHRRYKTIHVGGTNGKGSTAHLLAAILQESGYKVGLYTSPHLIDFSERIRVNGIPVTQEYVISFVEDHLDRTAEYAPSFFEFTMMLAFSYFAQEQVDVAVIEVGLGGRLDSTNIITPELSVITNISFDHMQFLGTTLEAIAGEKGGIIKPHIPVVIGKAFGQVRGVFERKAASEEAPIYWAQEFPFTSVTHRKNGHWLFESNYFPPVEGELSGDCQQENGATVFTSILRLRERGFSIPDAAVSNGFARVTELTGLLGRWQILGESPRIICDTGHNKAGIAQIVTALRASSYRTLRMVIGMVNDKDISGVLALLPRDACYYFTQASVPRAETAAQMAARGAAFGLVGNAYGTVMMAFEQAQKEAAPDDLIFVGGSTFVVADLLKALSGKQ